MTVFSFFLFTTSLLLSFLFPSITAKCNMGQWPSVEECHDCPQGFQCNGVDLPSQCPPGTRALQSSGTCCPQNLKCPQGFAVDNNNQCSCVSLKCPAGFTLTQSPTRLQCESTSTKNCDACASSGMVQNENCQCFSVRGCANGGTFWKYGSNYFACH